MQGFGIDDRAVIQTTMTIVVLGVVLFLATRLSGPVHRMIPGLR
jgi:hypothetical protein